MPIKMGIGLCLLLPIDRPAHAEAWTPHTAAALLDATFPTAVDCQRALDDARRREHAIEIESAHGLNYRRLFEQGRCASFHAKDGAVWRIRMHWVRRRG